MNDKLTLRQKLDIIDGWLSHKGGAQLWDVLSALRGPDTDDKTLKMETTVHIRAAAFPRTTNLPYNRIDEVYKFDEERAANSRAVFQTTAPFTALRIDRYASHFKTHIVKAAIALGLL